MVTFKMDYILKEFIVEFLNVKYMKKHTVQGTWHDKNESSLNMKERIERS